MNLIDLAAGQQECLDGAAARAAAWMQYRRPPNLLRQIGRGIDENPILAVGGDGETGLGTRPNPWIAGPGQLADGAAAVPLWEASTRRRAKHDCGEAPH